MPRTSRRIAWWKCGPCCLEQPRFEPARAQADRIGRAHLGSSVQVGADSCRIPRSTASCDLALEESGWRVEDLGARSGFLPQWPALQSQELVFGDLLRIGPDSLRFDGRFLQETAGSMARDGGVELANRLSAFPFFRRCLLNSVAPCQFVGLLGRAGGNSTPLDALCALRPADAGSVTIDVVDGRRNDDSLREELGYVPQDTRHRVAGAFHRASALPERPPAVTANAGHGNLEARLHRMRWLGIQERAGTPVGKLSGGQRRAKCRRGIALPPAAHVSDEPTSAFGPGRGNFGDGLPASSCGDRLHSSAQLMSWAMPSD